MHWYQFHELAVTSTVELPELVEIDPGNRQVCHVQFAASLERPAAPVSEVCSELDPLIVQSHDGTMLSFHSGVRCFVASALDKITVYHDADVELPTARHVLLDQVLPRLLAARGHWVIHASAVNYRGHAVVFVGESGHGKSSLAVSLYARGHALLGDDCFVLTRPAPDGSVTGMSTYRSLRLLPASVDEFYADSPSDAFASMGANYDKVRVVHAESQAPSLLPVAAIFVLASPGHTGPPIADVLSDRDAVLALMKNSFRLYPADMLSLASSLDQAVETVRETPVLLLHYERNFDALTSLHETIEEVVSLSSV